jgi:hypothetical protein
MTKDQALTELKKLKGSLKMSEIERAIDLPLNSLSKVLNGKEMPDSWVPRIKKYAHEQTIKTEKIENTKRYPWMPYIEAFCADKGIIPDELPEYIKKLEASLKTMETALKQASRDAKPTQREIEKPNLSAHVPSEGGKRPEHPGPNAGRMDLIKFNSAMYAWRRTHPDEE